MITDISSALQKAWEGIEGTNKMRACLFNLVIYAPKNSRSPYVRTLVQKVIERFPSRVIFLEIDETSTSDDLMADVSIVTGSKGEVDVVCDYIDIKATPKSQNKIPFVILPHFVPDLPIYVVWADDPCKNNPLIHEFDDWASRIIFDSETAQNLSAFATHLLNYYHIAGCDIADLNWARTDSWRELLSTTFHSPERLEQLEKAKSMTITYTPGSHVQAIYLKGWLTSELNWPWDLVTLQEKAADLPPGTIASVELFTKDDDHFSFSRSAAHPFQLSMILCTPEHCEIPSTYIFSKTQAGLSLVNEICQTGTSDHFLKLLAKLSQQCPL
jgi:glucose-6-phosphate dehydrogenase assembly protein OpcA